MQVSSRGVVEALADGTGLRPEEMAVIVAGAAVLAGAVVAVRVVDLVTRMWAPSGARS
jgi:methenyltetrahydromethanopterin cyclohydrolase